MLYVTETIRLGWVFSIVRIPDKVRGISEQVYNSTVVSKSSASRLFTQPFIQAQIKENIKAPRHWPLCGEFTGARWIPSTTSNAENASIWWRHHELLWFVLSCLPFQLSHWVFFQVFQDNINQTFTWTNDDTFHWRIYGIYVSLELNQL